MGCGLGHLLAPVPTEDEVEIITGAELRAILSKELRITNPGVIATGDRNYALIDPVWITKFITLDLTNVIPYQSERFDCDDFSIVLTGEVRKWFWKAKIDAPIAFGFLWGDIRQSEEATTVRGHAINFMVTKERKVVLIEPQTDNYSNFTTNSKVWDLIV